MHKRYEDLIPFYITGTLSESDAALVRDHLAQCAECRAVYAEWREISGGVQRAVGARSAQLPPLAPRVQQAVRNRPANISLKLQPTVTPLHDKRGKQPIPLAFLAAIIVVALISGGLGASFNRPTPTALIVAAAPTDSATDSPVTATPPPNVTAQVMLSTQEIAYPVPPLTDPEAGGAAASKIGNDGGNSGGGSDDPSLNPPYELTPIRVTETPSAGQCNIASASGLAVLLYRANSNASDVIGVLQPGQYAQSTVWDGARWYQLERVGVGVVGWAPAAQLTLLGPCDQLALPSLNLVFIPTQQATETPYPNQCNVASATTDAVPLYKRNAVESGIAGWLLPGQFGVSYLWDSTGWYEVVRSGVGIVGWARIEQLQLVGPCRELPLSSPTPITAIPVEAATSTWMWTTATVTVTPTTDARPVAISCAGDLPATDLTVGANGFVSRDLPVESRVTIYGEPTPEAADQTIGVLPAGTPLVISGGPRCYRKATENAALQYFRLWLVRATLADGTTLSGWINEWLTQPDATLRYLIERVR